MIRTEYDKLGEMAIEDSCYYGIHTSRALSNFALGKELVHPDLIRAIITIKKAAASAHRQLKEMDETIADAILSACDELLFKEELPKELFPLHPLQGGAGTSTNMNVNEVIANLALEKLNLEKGSYETIDPLDHVNMGQSTNDVYPTGVRIAAIYKVRKLSDQLSRLQEAFQQKELEFEAIKKLGRTQLQDALPITLGQEFGAYAQAIGRDRWRIYKVEERLRQINLGGTAVGTGSNASKQYGFLVVELLRDLTGLGLARAEYPMDLTQNCDVFTEISGLLKSLSVSLMKISGDLRLMASGPKGGLGEIHLPPVQAGSTIMPGKVNPVMTEMITQISIQVIACDQAITIASASGQLELNAFLPLIAHNLFYALDLLTDGIRLFREKCIEGILADLKNCARHLESSNVLITALVPHIGYQKATWVHDHFGNDTEAILNWLEKNQLLPREEAEKILKY